MSRIIDYTEATSQVSDDYLVIDSSTEGTRKIKANRISGLTDGIKDALLACFRSVAWSTEVGQETYQALYDALYPDERIVSISAVFTQGTAKIYTTDSLDVLKQYLTVTVTYYGGTESVTTDYVLSGVLEEGTSTITAIYGGKTATFNVTVTGEQTNLLYSWDFTKSLTDSVTDKTATTTATRDSNGLTFNGYGQYIDYDLSFSRDKTFEIDIDYIGTKVEGTTDHNTAYRRLLAFGENGTITESNTAAFLCSVQPGRPGWWWYLGSSWDSDAISQTLKDVSKYSFFDGKTIKIYVDSSGKCFVYAKTIAADDTTYALVGQSTNTLKAFTSAKVYMGGSGNDALADARITAFRIYDGEK